jgi:hypothetical protein
MSPLRAPSGCATPGMPSFGSLRHAEQGWIRQAVIDQ